MTGRERVKRCVNFDNPDRCPMTLPAPYPNDICCAGVADDPEWKPSRTWEFEDCQQWEDEWGNVWKRLPNTSKGQVVEGAIQDWSEAETYRMPRMDLAARYDDPRRVFAQSPDAYHLGFLPGFPFAIMRYLRKLEVFLADVLLHPGKVNALQRRVVDILKRCLDQWATAGCDGVMFAEDWGTQDRLLVAPRLWHEMFEWGYRELVNHAKNLDIAVWMHSCGYIKDITPTLVDIGVKVLQLDQPTLSGLDFLAETCRGKTTIWSPVDVQRDLPTGDEAHIRRCARELIDVLDGGSGGFICGYYGDPASLGVQPVWQMWAVNEFARYAQAKADFRQER